jgi:mono/diheme cytochrome c family protein
VFPTISTLSADGTKAERRLLFQPAMPAGVMGAFTDSCSGPHAIAFTPDGTLALLALAQSEDVMVFDVASGSEAGLVRPVGPPVVPPQISDTGMLEGIVVDHAGTHAYVDERNAHNVTVLTIDASNTIQPVAYSSTIERLQGGVDPMPAQMRHGQRLFYTANSGAFPLTQNFWVACASCHIEGGSDAVTWRFSEGPRDTPSNAGGPINTGFLLRQALRNKVEEYDATIVKEQGGNYHLTNAMQVPDLDALAAYVNYAIPFPQNPNLAPGGVLTASQQKGKATFTSLCASCHTGAYLTDSGAGNPTLDPSGTILLHDIGTCNTSTTFPDQSAWDYTMTVMHTACDFDTPTLRGIFATPPYLHDGSAATLTDVVQRLPFSSGLTASDQADLVAYLMTL